MAYCTIILRHGSFARIMARTQRRRDALTFRVRNVTRGTSIGDAIDTAGTSAERRTGLLKRDRLEDGTGLWIVPCEAVHTFFMKFAIDLIYLDRKRRVRGMVRGLRPWRLSMCLPAHSVLELPPGTIDRTQTQKGDQVELASEAGAGGETENG